MRAAILVLAGIILGSLLTLLVAPKLRETVEAGVKSRADRRSSDGDAERPGARPPEILAPNAPGDKPAAQQEPASVPTVAAGAAAPSSSHLPDLQSPEIQRDAEREIPTTQWGSFVKASRIAEEHQIAGDTSKYAGRVGLIGSGEFWLKPGARTPSSRLTPLDFAQFKDRAAGRESTEGELAARLPESWKLFTEESRILGAIAKRSQTIIEERVAKAKSTEDLVAIEVRMGKAYAVRKGEDKELDQLLFELDGVTRRKGDFLEVPR